MTSTPPRSTTTDHCSRADATAGKQECEITGASTAAAEPTLDRRAPTRAPAPATTPPLQQAGRGRASPADQMIRPAHLLTAAFSPRAVFFHGVLSPPVLNRVIAAPFRRIRFARTIGFARDVRLIVPRKRSNATSSCAPKRLAAGHASTASSHVRHASP